MTGHGIDEQQAAIDLAVSRAVAQRGDGRAEWGAVEHTASDERDLGRFGAACSPGGEGARDEGGAAGPLHRARGDLGINFGELERGEDAGDGRGRARG